MLRRLIQAIQNNSQAKEAPGQAAAWLQWDYKVVHMVNQAPPNADDASRKLGGSLSPEALKAQFPEYYSIQNGREQIHAFLNCLGADGWELIQIQQVADLPLMVFKRPKRSPETTTIATKESAEPIPHAGDLA
jgi:hypothetical protein